MPDIAKAIRKVGATEDTGGDRGAKKIFNNKIAYQLFGIFGYVPVCVAHTKEYVCFWQDKGQLPDVIVKGDYSLLRCAMMTDPLVTSIADADAILHDLLDLERDILPDHWYVGESY